MVCEKGQQEEGRKDADGSAQPKTRTPHNDVGNEIAAVKDDCSNGIPTSCIMRDTHHFSHLMATVPEMQP